MRMYSEDHLYGAWVAVQTLCRSEKTVAEYLFSRGYECFLPLQYKYEYRITPVPRNSKRLATVPLFDGYLFCKYKVERNFRIADTRNVIRVLSHKGIPAVIPDIEIESLKKVVASGLSMEPCQFIQADQGVCVKSVPLNGADFKTFLKSGQKVRINSVPLKEVEGYFVQVVGKDTCKIAVGVSVLQKSVLISLLNADISVVL